MKLIDKMTKYGVWRQEGQNDIAPELRQSIFESLRAAVCVEVGNVAEWYHHYTGEPRNMQKISPIFRLPFDDLWLEYVNRWGLYGRPLEDRDVFHVGCLLTRADHHFEKNRPDYVRDGEWQHATGMIFVQVQSNQMVMAADRFACLCTPDHALSRMVMERHKHKDEDTGLTITKELSAAMFPAMAAISFFHCGNVRLVNEYPDKPLSKRFAQKHGEPLRVMKTIDIHRPRDIRRRSKQEEHSTRVLEDAVLVRGHLKRYNNLFGSIAGVWFWSPHVRGVGVPRPRDYEVYGPNEKHHGKCVIDA